MAFDIAFGQYYNTASPIHRLDPRVKMGLLAAFMVGAFLADSHWGLLLLFFVLLGVIYASHIPFRKVLKSIAPLSFIFIFPLFFNIFFVKTGTVLFEWNFILVTDEGIYRAVFMTMRLFLLFLSATILTLTTSPIALCDATESILTPLERVRVPAHEIAMMMSIALRFIPTLLEEFDKIKKAQMARGAVFDDGGPIARVKAIIPIMIPLFASSFRHAEELALAMESRCYHGGKNRTHYRILMVQKRDYVAFVLALCLLVVLAVWL